MDSNLNQNEAKQAEQKMLDAIRSGKARMQPKWHFILQAILFATGGIIALLALLYLASFVVFTLQETGLWFAPVFGVAGWYSFFRSLPWLLLLLVAVFMVVLGVLAKQYSFVYERPTLYLFIGIVAFIALGGFLIAQTSFHRVLFNSARHGNLPILGGFYRGFDAQRFGDIRRGMIIGTTTHGFIVQDDNGQTSTVFSNQQMHFPPGGVSGIGSNIVIFGRRSPSGTINAAGIQPIGQ